MDMNLKWGNGDLRQRQLGKATQNGLKTGLVGVDFRTFPPSPGIS